MKKHAAAARLLSLPVGVLAVVCVLALVPNGSPTQAVRAQDEGPRVINNTAGFQVINLVREQESYVLTLKNTYSKPINGYMIGVGPKSKLTVDLTVGDRVVAPGEAARENIPISNLRSPADSAYRDINVLGVLFEDGTSDGNAQATQETKERRKGSRLLLKRALALLDAGLASSGEPTPAVVSDLKAQISSLSADGGANQSLHISLGARAAKQDLLTLLEELERNPSNLKDKLHRIKKQVDGRVVRLERGTR